MAAIALLFVMQARVLALEQYAANEETVSEAGSPDRTTEEKRTPTGGSVQSEGSSRPGGNIYKTKPPNPYPGEKTILEPGEDFEAYNQVIDDGNKDRFRARGWSRGKAKSSYKGRFRIGGKSSSSARYKVQIPETDVYSVFAWWPGGREKTKARIGVETVSGMKWTEVSQDREGGYWVPIGQYELKKGDRYRVTIEGVRGATPPVADGVGIVRGIEDFPPDPGYLGPVPQGSVEESSGEQIFEGQSRARKISRQAIMRRAKSHLGTPYKLGGLDVCVPKKWEDCSCFTRLVFGKWRLLADNPAAQMTARRMTPIRASKLRRGDLVFHDTTRDGRMSAYDHVSIYAGNGYVIHANSYYLYKKVHFQEMKWLANYKGARRVRY